jgi:2-amino-4-hydroxy-6-hydroxymethyldihydropteridine diphosphokinase
LIDRSIEIDLLKKKSLLARAAIAIGSNLGDRRAHLAWAVERLGSYLANPRVSSIIETAAVDVPEPQPPYLNGAIVGEARLGPVQLMQLLLALERERGRVRDAPRAARTLDLDLILYADRIVRTPALEVPHPRFRERRFVLEPLAEVAPDWKDPVTGQTVREILDSLPP